VIYQNFDGVTHDFFGTGLVVQKAKYAVDLVGRELKQVFLWKQDAFQSSAVQERP
jgi:hypothetical protein